MHDVATRHQIKIAKKSLTMSDAGLLIMGGPTRKEAREILKKAGWSDHRIERLERYGD